MQSELSQMNERKAIKNNQKIKYPDNIVIIKIINRLSRVLW